MSPLTQRKIETDVKASKVKKIGACATFLSLLKGFVCTAILFLPQQFAKAGWLFMILAFMFSMFLTTFCATLIIDVRKVINLPSYTAIGERLFGKKGRIAVDIALFSSQAGFCCGYVFFIVDNIHKIIENSITDSHDKWITAAVLFIIFTLLAWVRKIELFAQTHVFADIMILVTLIYVIIYGGVYTGRKDPDNSPESTPAFVSSGLATGFGFSIYSFEGIGIIFPVQDVTAVPEKFR